jgi:hypothetical protein
VLLYSVSSLALTIIRVQLARGGLLKEVVGSAKASNLQLRSNFTTTPRHEAYEVALQQSSILRRPACLGERETDHLRTSPSVSLAPRRLTTAHKQMSATMTLTMSQAPDGGGTACPNCGIGLPHPSEIAPDAQKQIEDLQAQVRLLTQKATAAGTSFHQLLAVKNITCRQLTGGPTTKTRFNNSKHINNGV